MASECLAFQVKRCEPELIVPSKPTPHELKYLSDIDDQEFLRIQVPFILYYKNTPNASMEGKDPVRVIREALGKALVYYYPLAGRLMEVMSNRKLVVDCNGKGVLFIEAYADISLHQLGNAIQPPYSFLDHLLYKPYGFDVILGCPLLLIQVTRLVCGGFILASRYNHTMLDGFGIFQFMNTLTEMAQGAEQPSVPPVWQRELLAARNPPRITCTHHEYDNEADIADKANSKQTNMVQCSFFFGPNQIKAIRKHLPPHLANFSRFELLTACLWKCRTLALNLKPEDSVQVSPSVTARGLNQNHGLHLPSGYYGNAFAFPAAVSKAGDLCKKPLGYAVELVKKAKEKMNEEYIRSVADFMVIRGRPYHKGNFGVGDTTKAPFGELNFGCGCPVYGGPAMAFPKTSLHAKYKHNGENGILVLICLQFLGLERFKQELKKMTDQEANTCNIVKPFKMMSTI